MNVPRSLRILVADDDSLVCDVVQSELEYIGHQIIGRASDGRQAVEMAQSLQPDIVVMDIAMPEMDGLAATQRIQETSPRPVVLLTAHDDAGLVNKASLAGAGAYLVKPPNGHELSRTMTIAMARFGDLMELRRLNHELQKSMAEVKTLRGILPICASCKKIRDSRGYWQHVETYIRDHSDADFSHGLCDDCLKQHFPEVAEKPSA